MHGLTFECTVKVVCLAAHMAAGVSTIHIQMLVQGITAIQLHQQQHNKA